LIAIDTRLLINIVGLSLKKKQQGVQHPQYNRFALAPPCAPFFGTVRALSFGVVPRGADELGFLS
tara:strand:- start:247 stop:441 length:195 start_codon:yes stop_codon:yes gene_type:complete